MASSYANQKVPISGALSSMSLNWTPDVSSSFGRFHGTATIPPEIEFIPPQTFVTRRTDRYDQQRHPEPPRKRLFEEKGAGDEVDVCVLLGWLLFRQRLRRSAFSSYLTFVVGDTLPGPMVYQHNFYVSELVKMTDPPQVLTTTSGATAFYGAEMPAIALTYGYGVVGGKARYYRNMHGRCNNFPGSNGVSIDHASTTGAKRN